MRDESWGGATHYAGGQPVEPRTFTEADPIAGAPLLDDTALAPIAEPADETAPPRDTERWGTTTYVGKRRRRRRERLVPQHAAPAETAPPRHAAPDQAAAPDLRAAAEAPATAQAAEQPAADAQPETAEAGGRSLLANSRTMAIATFASRLTGLVRSILLVAALGTGAVANAYNSGNNLPNMIYELLLGGVLSSVLIPLLVKAEAEDTDRGLGYTQRLFSIATVALGVMTIVVVAAAPWIAAIFVPPGSQRELTGVFATLLLPEIFFYGLGAMFMAVLNLKNIYRPGAWAPVLNNVVMMVTVLIFWILPGPKTL
ncbi:MAG TPA: lipid II flippase MurJ, partial [Jatrophihabitans sp.]|nr:lipid II flippase MurJ [Jatrophihabitans sp.]